jgi:hypothetical protein
VSTAPGACCAHVIRRNIDNGDPTDASNVRKPNEGKKRSWDEFLNTGKPAQDQERRPNKRRHGNDGRNRRNNRNRHGNKGGGGGNRKYVSIRLQSILSLII